MKFLIALLFLIPFKGYSQNQAILSNLKILDVDQFYIEYEQFKGRRDPYLPEFNDRWRDRTNVKFNVNILGALYFDSRIHMESLDNGTYKSGGWEWFVGARLFSWADIFFHHHSQHVFEKNVPSVEGKNTFPVEDAYGIRIKLIDGPKRRSLFK